MLEGGIGAIWRATKRCFYRGIKSKEEAGPCRRVGREEGASDRGLGD